MKIAALVLLSALFVVGCDREGYKDSHYSKPMDKEALNSTNGLDPDARIDMNEPRPPSEAPGVQGSGSGGRIQNPDEALGTSAPPRKL